MNSSFVVAVHHHQRGVERSREARIVELGERYSPIASRAVSLQAAEPGATSEDTEPAPPWSHLTVHIRVFTVSGPWYRTAYGAVAAGLACHWHHSAIADFAIGATARSMLL